MKRIQTFILTLSLAVFATIAFAQIKVVAPSGDVGIGTTTPTEKLEIAGLVKSEGGTVETTGSSATELVARTDGSAMLFGAGVGAGFSWDNSTNFTIRSNGRANIESRLLTTGALRLYIQGSDGRVGLGSGAPTAKLHVVGNVFCSGMYQGSDRRLKENVGELKYGLDQIMAMNTVTYTYKKELQFDDSNQKFGVMAQDLQEIMPELVSSFEHERYNEDGSVMDKEKYLMIDNDALKYVLVNAIQEQQAMIQDQADRIDELETMVKGGDYGNVDGTILNQVAINGYDTAELAQNVPNPFNGETTIDYVIPTDASNATINIYNLDGKMLKSISLDHQGKGQLRVTAEDIPSGSYSYQLVVDGRSIDTKKMVISK